MFSSTMSFELMSVKDVRCPGSFCLQVNAQLLHLSVNRLTPSPGVSWRHLCGCLPGLPFCSPDLCVCAPITPGLGCCSFTVNLEVRLRKCSNFTILPHHGVSFSWSLLLNVHFRISLPKPANCVPGILVEIVLNL